MSAHVPHLASQPAVTVARLRRSYGARVVIDEVSLELLKGAEIDFVEDLLGSYFKVANPNATTSCGCGSSFSVA